jgi:hypothetical protein
MKMNQVTFTVGGAICVSLLASYGAQAQNLFASNNNNIYQITPGGAVTTFISNPDGDGLAFGPNGNLFAA